MSERNSIVTVLAAALLVAAAPAAAQAAATGTTAVEVTAEVYGQGRTPEEGRREALQRARDKAVAEVTGIHIAAQQLRLRSVTNERVDDAFSYLVHTSTHGRIVREQVSFDTRIVDDVPVYRANLLAEVALEEGAPDPGFTVDLSTRPAAHTFRDGEEIGLEVTVSRDCYLTVLNLHSDGTVGVLFPNRFDGGNRVQSGETARLPGRPRAFEIRAALDGDRDGTSEQLLVIATLDPVPFRLPDAVDGESELAAEGDPTLAALNRWLLQIPVHRRAEAMWDYRVIE
jgi:hypothetical protein